MCDEDVVAACVRLVKEGMAGNDSSHDWFHVQRVTNTALRLAEEEGVEDRTVVQVGALLHDVWDHKYAKAGDLSAEESAAKFLTELGMAEDRIARVVAIISGVSFSSELALPAGYVPPKEVAVVQDADRLDAIGAIGIARCLTFGGSCHRTLHDPDVPPALGLTKEEYKRHEGTTVNHFYEKLLTLAGRMKTDAGRRTADARHAVMVEWLDQFHAEWKGEK